ncbi:E3 ubiquitin-protein ligase ZNF598 [Homalodisca vitripennis]|uniref:E3 ubiquitin-protein ligase ZNF598 n=1 Tax=Homalodisca vitripennis TaxID=197043 RepID=UPI001EEB529D|nr:E3 ubiquitin-protein ligase ZNF598 [Homalodisca vitripennis]
MSNNNDDSFNENTCVVCFKNVDIYSIGDCDHPVCYECSTRMRVLCRQNECPICRHDMQKVIFTKTVRPFKELDELIGTKCLLDRKFKIVFESTDTQHAYNTLLAHVCSKCPGRHAFQTFAILREHMRKEHELFYCDLCVENLKILTHERRCYTRKELGMHRRQGDPDNRSHRGHPLCEFCDRRYMDNDELYRHLRRDHLYCHFCDTDGLHQYYDSYDELRNHFRQEHYLCEEGECYEEKFTSVFRTDIDLKAHRALVHGRQMTKAAAKQARTLELAFTLKPRPRQAEQRRAGGRGNSRYHSYSDEEEGAVGGMAGDYHRSSQPSSAHPTFSKINTASNDEFPSLGGSSAPVSRQGLHFPKPGGVTIHRTGGKLAMTEEDFPALAPEATASVSLRVNSVSAAERAKGSKPTNVSIHVNHRPGGVVATVSSSKNSHSRERDPFPALQNSYNGKTPVATSSTQWNAARDSEPKMSVKSKSTQQPSKSQQKSSKNYNYDDDDFPIQNNFPARLTGNVPSHIASLATTQWSSGREPEPKFSVNKNKSNQPPPPKLPQPKTFHIEDDFPSLNSRFDASCSFTPEPVEPKPPESKAKRESSISISVDNDWTKASKNVVSNDNISSDSDIGSRKSGKKKKNKSKTKKDLVSEPAKSVPVKSSNNENGKKNKQKEEPKAKSKQIKVESQVFENKVKSEETSGKKVQETLERKRSELKIQSLNGQPQQDNNINMSEFPSLSGKRLPPGFSNPVKEKTSAPPGFEGPSAPPPGFSITLNSVARPPSNGLTFTSSSGQNYAISPSGEGGGSSRVFTYVPPPNIKKRNAELVVRVTTALGTQAALDEFLQMSGLYRQGSLTAEAYYNHCREAMGNKQFTEIFPELLVLLPDIGKQQDLWKVAEQCSEWRLHVCAACAQVVAATDFKHHHATHSLENHFPTLANGLTGPNAWRK